MKKLPDNFQETLNSTALAIWFLDDGGRSSGVKAGVFLTVDNYTFTEIEVIQKTFKTRFGIETQLNLSGKSLSGLQQKRISITGENYTLFCNLISPLRNQIPSMISKKLGLVGSSLRTP